MKCYIIGCGLSAAQFDLNQISAEDYVIAVNRAYYLFKSNIDKLGVILWQDLNFYSSHGLQLRRINCKKMCYATAGPDHPSIDKFNINKNIKPGWNNKINRYSGSLTSGARAVQLAYVLGFKHIVTVGMLAIDEPEFFGVNKRHSPYTIPAFKKDREFINTFPGTLEEF